MGVGTVMDAHEVLILITGANKSYALYKVLYETLIKKKTLLVNASLKLPLVGFRLLFVNWIIVTILNCGITFEYIRR